MKSIGLATVALTAPCAFGMARSLITQPRDQPGDLSFDPPSDAVHLYNTTRDCVVVIGGKEGIEVFLEAPAPQASCHTNLADPPLSATYANTTRGFARATCPDNETDGYLPESIYPTFRFSSAPQITFLDRPHAQGDRLCLNVHMADLRGETQFPPPEGEVIQPIRIVESRYNELCVVTSSSAPTPRVVEESPGRDTGRLGILGGAVLLTIGGIAACFKLRRQERARVQAQDDGVQLANLVVLPRAPIDIVVHVAEPQRQDPPALRSAQDVRPDVFGPRHTVGPLVL
ncbi:MAG: hypothetical protein H7255_13435 [Ramlibacter sp.]|nr:hypothetical protein [Ramlibacter sp.]